MLARLRTAYDEFPGTFWTLMGASFIDRLGGALLFPFFALYVTAHFDVGMTQVGVLFTIFSVASIAGGFVGGALTDKFGRRGVLIFGLVMSATSSLAMGLVNDLSTFYLLAALSGVLSDVGQPAQQAIVADILPKDQQAQGFGIWRVIINIAVAIGPAIGGLLATRSYLGLFIADAISSYITAAVVFFILPETKPQATEDHPEETVSQSLVGYLHVARDRAFVAFLFVTALSILVYAQMYTTLSVYLRDIHNIPDQGYGLLLSFNATMVVFLQFWITRRLSGRAPMLILVWGCLFYAVGFGMYGFGSGMLYFAAAMAVLTIGEMFIAPTGQAIVGNLAPAAMRGRYMAGYSFAWGLPFGLAPLFAGLVMDNYNPNWIWYGCIILGAISALGFLALHPRLGPRLAQGVESDSPAATASTT